MSDYLSYWGMPQAAFLQPVSPAHFFHAPSRAGWLRRLQIYCGENQACVAIAAGPGSGKTTLLKWLYMNLPVSTHEVLLLQLVRKETEAGWLLPRFAALLGLRKPLPVEPGSQLREIATKLENLGNEGKRLVIAIDQAHLIAADGGFGDIDALLNLGTLTDMRLAFILVGDVSLRQNLEETATVAARVNFFMPLPPLLPEEVPTYIQHKLKLANAEVPFDQEATAAIAASSAGVPGAIDHHAESCLVEAFLRGGRRITGDVALAARRTLLKAQPKPDLGASAAPEPSAEGVKIFGELPPPPRERAVLPSPPENERETPAERVKPTVEQPIKLASLFKTEKRNQDP